MSSTPSRVKSIYLDWNIFQDIIQGRKSERLIENIEAGKRKGYSTPYSHAHMSDLLRCSNSDYVKNDLEQVARISDGLLIGPHGDGSGFCTAKVPPSEVYAAMQADQANKQFVGQYFLQFSPYKVEVSKISKDNILIPYLNQFDGMMCPALMEAFIKDLADNGLGDYKLQRSFRNSIVEMAGLKEPAAAALLALPLFKYLLSPAEEIEENLIEILQSFHGLSGNSLETMSESDKFLDSYGVLDFFPALKEKIEKRDNMNNMLTDAQHVYIASKCSYFICGDTKSIRKAKALYRAFNVKTKVYYIDDFISKVEF